MFLTPFKLIFNKFKIMCSCINIEKCEDDLEHDLEEF